MARTLFGVPVPFCRSKEPCQEKKKERKKKKSMPMRRGWEVKWVQILDVLSDRERKLGNIRLREWGAMEDFLSFNFPCK